jgi:hypothetical protein
MTTAKQFNVSIKAPEMSGEINVRPSNLDEDERFACYDIARAVAAQTVFSQEVTNYIATISATIAVQIATSIATDIGVQLVEAAAPAIITAARSATQADAAQLASAMTDSVRAALEAVVTVLDVGHYTVEFERDLDGRITSAAKRPA